MHLPDYLQIQEVQVPDCFAALFSNPPSNSALNHYDSVSNSPSHFHQRPVQCGFTNALGSQQDSQDSFSQSLVYSQMNYRKKRTHREISKGEPSARKNRTKMYIQMLQKKVQSLQKEVKRLEAVNQSNQEYLKKISVPEEILNGFFVGRAQIYKRLESLVKKAPSETTRCQIVKEISALRYRCGVNGKDRIKATNYYFKELLELIIPQSQKYLIYTAYKGVDFFNKQFVQKLNAGDLTKFPDTGRWKVEMVKNMDLTQTKLDKFNSFRECIVRCKHRYDELVLKLYQAKQEVCTQAKHMENIFDEFRELFDPYQLSRILLQIDANKHRKEITMNIDSFWDYSNILKFTRCLAILTRSASQRVRQRETIREILQQLGESELNQSNTQVFFFINNISLDM